MCTFMPSLRIFLFAPLFYYFTLDFLFYLHPTLLWPRIQGQKYFLTILYNFYKAKMKKKIVQSVPTRSSGVMMCLTRDYVGRV